MFINVFPKIMLLIR